MSTAQALTAKTATAPAVIDASALLSKAVEHQLPVESMQRLLEMRAQLKAEEAAGAFAAALADFQRDLPPIEKRQTAKIQSQRGTFSYQYADLADIQRAIAEKLAENGLSITFDTADHGERLDVICTVHHVAGHSSSARFPVPVDRGSRMNAAQQVGAALTYGRRYALTAALGIVTADEDTDAQGAPERPAATAAAPNGRRATQPSPKAEPHTGTPPAAAAGPQGSSGASGDKGDSPMNAAQKRRLEARISELGLQPHRERLKAWTAKKWQCASLAELTRSQYAELYQRLDDFAERIATAEQARENP
jgi:hypothetical protein